MIFRIISQPQKQFHIWIMFQSTFFLVWALYDEEEFSGFTRPSGGADQSIKTQGLLHRVFGGTFGRRTPWSPGIGYAHSSTRKPGVFPTVQHAVIGTQ